MDTIEFKLNHFRYGPYNYDLPVVDIFINHQDFLPVVEKYENNTHAQILPEELYKNLTEYYKEDPVYVFGCGCSVPECSPVEVNIDIGEKIVMWYDFTFGSMENIVDREGKLGRFVFDKAQYFQEVEKLKDWISDDTLDIWYGSISYGYLTLNVKKGEKKSVLFFGDLTSDPIPQLVRFRNHVAAGEEWQETITDFCGDGDIIFGITAYHCGFPEKMQLEIQLSKEGTVFYEVYPIAKIVGMIDDILQSLLHDDGFPYVYPCFCRLSEDNAADEEWEKMEEEVQMLIEKDSTLDEEACMMALVAKGRIPLEDGAEEIVARYRKMLIEHVIPDRWLEGYLGGSICHEEA